MVVSFEEAMQTMYDAQHHHICKLHSRRRVEAARVAYEVPLKSSRQKVYEIKQRLRQRHESYLCGKARAENHDQPSSIAQNPVQK